jgi:FixJ family two-component response regulator
MSSALLVRQAGGKRAMNKSGELAMTGELATVIVLDNDSSSCQVTEHFIRSAGLPVEVRVFHTATAWLCHPRPGPPACVVLETRLPGMSGLDLQRELTRRGTEIPLLFITAHADIPMAVQAIKAGAIDFLTKPFRRQDLLTGLRQAFQSDQAAHERRCQLASLREHYHLLTPSEREVMARVVAGLLNKQTAAQLGITEKTVKFHRGRVMRKMQAQSAIDLAKMAERLSICPASVCANGESRGYR